MSTSGFQCPFDEVLFEKLASSLPKNMSAFYEGDGPKGYFTIFRRGIFISEIAHIVSHTTEAKPYFRWYVGNKTRQLIQKIVDDSR